MKISFVGNFTPPFSTENDVRLALESLGHTVIPLQENRTRPQTLRAQALNSDLLLWTSTWDLAQSLDETLHTIMALRKAGIPSAAYHLDIFHGLDRGGRRWWLSPMFQLDHVFTADGDHARDWQTLRINHHHLRAGVRHTATSGIQRSEYTCNVAFVGSDGRNTMYHKEWPYRRELVDKLEEICQRRGWSFRNPGGRHPKVDRGNMADFYASATVTVGDSLCLSRERSFYWSDRPFEATGRGGYLIMPQIDALSDDFDGFLPMYPWGDWEKLESEIDIGLMNESQNTAVREKCMTITHRHHTYQHRMRELLGVIFT